jgi:PKHD-type hydroxylase
MRAYPLPPTPSPEDEMSMALWGSAFSPAELDAIVAMGDKLMRRTAGVGGGEIVPATRRSSVAWIPMDHETAWILDRLSLLARRLNGRHWNFDLWGFVEQPQYTIYEGGDDGHYGWHVDRSAESPAPRKLSISVQLSDPDDYDGGDFEVLDGQTKIAPRTRGTLIAFPSFTLHRVTPVTRGIRRSLVLWICGPRFR